MRYRFVGIVDGKPRIASVSVRARAASAAGVTFTDEVSPVDRLEFAAAIEAGVSLAQTWWSERGGCPHEMIVDAVEFYPADTTLDAMECAATMAAWLALGGAEDALVKRFVDGRWRWFL